MFKVEQGFRAKRGRFGTLAELGASGKTQGSRYHIEMTGGEGSFHAVATQRQRGSLTDCDNGKDAWTLTESGDVTHTTNGLSDCSLGHSAAKWFQALPF